MNNLGSNQPDAIERARQLTAEAEHLYSVTIRRKETVLAAKERAMRITGEAVAPDGSVRATVDVGGMLTELVLGPEVARRKSDDLAELIVSTAQEAAGRARSAVQGVYAPLLEEGMVRDLPVLLPEPPGNAAPKRRARRSAYEEEPPYEDTPSVLRSEDR